MKFAALPILACLLAGCATHVEIQDHVRTLRSGSFAESRQAGKTVLADPEFAYGASRGEIIGALGQPDYETEDGNDVCYKTGGGPLWFTFQDNQLIYKAIVSPPRWRGTDAELAKFWEQQSKTDTWHQW
jgi:hypothetical protein